MVTYLKYRCLNIVPYIQSFLWYLPKPLPQGAGLHILVLKIYRLVLSVLYSPALRCLAR